MRHISNRRVSAVTLHLGWPRTVQEAPQALHEAPGRNFSDPCAESGALSSNTGIFHLWVQTDHDYIGAAPASISYPGLVQDFCSIVVDSVRTEGKSDFCITEWR